MVLNYDPDKTPQLTDEMLEQGKANGLQAVAFICDEPGAQVGDTTGVSFWALVATVPRVGEIIALEDGRECTIVQVRYRVGSARNDEGKVETIMLVPQVYAIANR